MLKRLKSAHKNRFFKRLSTKRNFVYPKNYCGKVKMSTKNQSKKGKKRVRQKVNIFPEAGMYIHVPFCISKCKYCDFYSLTNKEELIPEYVKRLKNALEYYRNRYARRYNSLYFGGGTPLLLGKEHLCDIMASAAPLLSKRAEVTAEGNPAAGGKIDFGASSGIFLILRPSVSI